MKPNNFPIFKMKLFILLPVLGLMFITCSCYKDKDKQVKKEIVRPAKIILVRSGNSQTIHTFPAEVKASERSELAFRVSGELSKLPIKAGDIVKIDQLLAQIDQANFKLRLDDRKGKYDLAKVQFERSNKLVKDLLIPISDFDKAKSHFLTAQVDLELSKQDMEHTTLRAPIDGRISKVYVKKHENIQAKQPIMVIQTQGTIDLEFYVPESIVAKVKKRKPDEVRLLEVKFDQFLDKTYKAKVKEFDTEADPKTQSYRVLATMKAPEGFNILPGMTATVIANSKELMNEDKSQIVLPVGAVFAAEEKDLNSEVRFVWKYDSSSGLVSRHPVKVGELTSDGIIIKSGISSGEQIVAAGVHFLKEGQKVRPLERERGL